MESPGPSQISSKPPKGVKERRLLSHGQMSQFLMHPDYSSQFLFSAWFVFI